MLKHTRVLWVSANSTHSLFLPPAAVVLDAQSRNLLWSQDAFLKMKKGAPVKVFPLATNTIFDTGCTRLQSCIFDLGLHFDATLNQKNDATPISAESSIFEE